MNHQRSRSRERPNPYRPEQNDQFSSPYNYQRPPSTDRIVEERSSSNPKQYSQNSLYPPYQGQFRKSPSPINKLQKQSKPQSSNLNPSQYQVGMQKLSLKDMNLKKLQKLQQLESILKSIKKPFQLNDIGSFQSVIQRLSPKYKFEQIYSVFVYFFVHYSLLDENIYRMFYSIIGKGVLQVESMTEMGENPLLNFYDILIKCTLKVSFDEFKNVFLETQKLNVESYFMISQQQRQNILNKSLYPSSSGQVGSSIRNTLTLIRKSMQRQKVSGERSPDFIHPIRQILKLIKTSIKSLLQKIFIPQQQFSFSEEVESNNGFYLILFSELSMVIHSKYKHHLAAEYEQTLNENTILKMKISEMKQQLESKFHTKTNVKKEEFSPRGQLQIMKALQFNYQRLRKQHNANYLYLLFVINLGTYNRNSSIGEKMDSTIFSFFVQPLIDQYTKSSQFLAQKIEQNINNKEKLRFFLSTVKNYGMYEQLEKNNEGTIRSKLYKFIDISYSNLVIRSIDFISQIINENKQNVCEKLVSIFNSLSFKQSSFNKINELKSIKCRINNLKKPFSQMEIQQQKKQLKSTHLQDEFSFLIDHLINIQMNNFLNKRKIIVEKMKKGFEKVQSVANKEPTKKSQVFLQRPKLTGQQRPLSQQQRNNKCKQNLTQLIKVFKQYFINRQNYYKLVIFIYFLYKNHKFQKANLFAEQYQSLRRQIQNQNNSEEIIDEQDQVIESLTENEKIALKLNELVNKKIGEIKYLNSCENEILKCLTWRLSQQKNKGYQFSIEQYLNTIIQGMGNNEKLCVSSERISFVGLILYEQEQNQKTLITQCLSEQIKKDCQLIRDQKWRKRQQQRFLKRLSKQIQLLSRLIKRWLQIEQNLKRPQRQSRIERIINEKKKELVSKQIEIKLDNIITEIKSIHSQCYSKQSNQSSPIIIDLQIVIQTLLIKLFQFQRQTAQIKKDDNPKVYVTKNGQNQKQTLLRHQLTNTINIKSSNHQPNYTCQSTYFYTPKEYLLSHLLLIIYKKFASPSINNYQSNQLKNTNIYSLQDLLILKLKKSISLFYDKINDYMLNDFILTKRLFILRCLAITFYKIKPLAEIILNKYGVLTKGYGSNLSPQMTKFVQDIFFFIPNLQALQSYLKFITTKDRFFIKTQLKKYHSLTNGKVDKLISMLDSM